MSEMGDGLPTVLHETSDGSHAIAARIAEKQKKSLPQHLGSATGPTRDTANSWNKSTSQIRITSKDFFGTDFNLLRPVGDTVTAFHEGGQDDSVLKFAREHGFVAGAYLTVTKIHGETDPSTPTTDWYNEQMYGEGVKKHYLVNPHGRTLTVEE